MEAPHPFSIFCPMHLFIWLFLSCARRVMLAIQMCQIETVKYFLQVKSFYVEEFLE